MNDTEFKKLLIHLGLSWNGYRKVRKGVKKRVRQHMSDTGCKDIKSYISIIENNKHEYIECKKRLTVPITRFFRDPHVWETLETDILPALLKNRSQMVRVWSAGCSGGEEAYSFKILWQMVKKEHAVSTRLEIHATDINPDVLLRAQKGVYPASSLKRVSEKIKTRYFKPLKKQLQIIPELKTGIIWELRDLFDTPPAQEFDIIFLRNNLLTYYQDGLKIPAFNRIIDCLKHNGSFVTGAHERLPESCSCLIRNKTCPLIYTKRGD